MAASGTVTKFFVALSTKAAGGNLVKYTLRRNGALIPAASCSNVSATTLECSVTSISIPFAAGDRMDVAVQANGPKPPAPGVVTWSVQYGP
jgi:hypothetical protein